MEESTAAARLNRILENAGLARLDDRMAEQFVIYSSLILRWNARLNLTAIRTEDAIFSNHLMESIACARALPKGTATLLDLGSGAGLPGIPIALCRPEIAVTLAESQGKKAAFLQEAARTLGLTVKVHADRAETLRELFDCVTLRAVDKMSRAVATAAALVRPGGWLVPMTTNTELPKLQEAAGPEFSWSLSVPLPQSTDRIIALATRKVS